MPPALSDWATVGDEEVGDTPDDERPGWALTKLLEAIDAELEALAAHRATLDHAALAADQLAAVDLAPLEIERAAELARRYEAATARELSRTIRDILLVEAMAAEAEPKPEAVPEPESTPEPDRNSLLNNEIGPIASFSKTPLPAADPREAAATIEPGAVPVSDQTTDPEPNDTAAATPSAPR